MAISADLSSLIGNQNAFTPGGATGTTVSAGKKVTAGSGVKKQPEQPPPPPMNSGQVASAVMPPKPKLPGPPHPASKPQFSASNPMMGVQPPPAPHPGVNPIYPDARSQHPLLMPNGVPVLPPPHSALLGGMPRIPPSFAPSALPAQGMSGLLK